MKLINGLRVKHKKLIFILSKVAHINIIIQYLTYDNLKQSLKSIK